MSLQYDRHTKLSLLHLMQAVHTYSSYLWDMTYCFSVMGSCRAGLRGPLLPPAALPASAEAWLRLLHCRVSH